MPAPVGRDLARQRLADDPPGGAVPLAAGRAGGEGAGGAGAGGAARLEARDRGARPRSSRRRSTRWRRRSPAAKVGFLVAAGPVALTLFYGLMRLAGVGFAQLRDGIFARVGQRALRQLALETFRHVHALSLRYHITRKTGGLSRVDRARRQGRRLPAALPAPLDRPADPRAGAGRRPSSSSSSTSGTSSSWR